MPAVANGFTLSEISATASNEVQRVAGENSLLDYQANPFETDEKITLDREQVQARVDAQVRTN